MAKLQSVGEASETALKPRKGNDDSTVVAIWDLLDNRKSHDFIMTKLDCSRKDIQNAIELRQKTQTNAIAPPEKEWQFDRIYSRPVEQRPRPDEDPIKQLDALTQSAVEKRTAKQDQPEPRWRPPKKKKEEVRERDRIFDEPIKIVKLVPPPIVSTPAEASEIAATKTTVIMVYVAAFKAFRITAEELCARDKDVRVDGYRNAILLVLNHLGVRPEVAAIRMDRTHQEAVAMFAHARKVVFDSKLISAYSTRNLCFYLKIDFDELRKKLSPKK